MPPMEQKQVQHVERLAKFFIPQDHFITFVA
jgi:hypothetical protein